MPEVPLWTRQESIPEVRIPRVDSSAAGGPERAMARTVGELGQISVEMGKKLADMQAVQQYGNTSVAMQKQLMDLHDGITRSPEFISNPELAEKKFLDGAEKIKQGFQGQISNARIQQQVQSDFGHHLLSYTTQLRHSVVQQQSINAKGDLLTNMNSLLNMGVSGDELIAGQSKEKFANLVAASIATGSIKADSGKEMVLKFNQQMDEGRLKRLMVLAPPGTASQALANGMFRDIPETDRIHLFDMATKRDEAEIQKARTLANQAQEDIDKAAAKQGYDTAMRDFAGNKEAALQWLSLPSTMAGASPGVKERIKGYLESDIAQEQRQKDRERVETNRKTFNDFVNKKLTLADVDASTADAEIKLHVHEMARKSYEETYKTDQATYLRTVVEIESGKITRNEDLYSRYGNGIGIDKKDDLEKMIHMKNDPSTGPFFKQAVEMFDDMYAYTQDKKARKPEFIMLLKEEIKTGNLKGEDILKKAQGLLQYAPKKWYDFGNPNDRIWERTIEERPWLKLDVSPEEAKRPSAPLTGNTVRQAVPKGVTDQNRKTFDAMTPGDRAIIVNYLRANNLPITDELILEGYRQMQGAASGR